jgi:hypothetical protein
MEKKKIMIIGLGVLGKNLLDMLSRLNKQPEIIVAGRNYSILYERANLSDLVALQLGYYPNIKCVELDLMNIDQTTEVISKERPDIIFNATSLMSYWVPSQLPKEIFQKLYWAFTGWQVPMHLTLTYKLMQAVHQTGLPIRVVNGSYPDVVNPALHKVGLGPEVGIGNVANVVPVIRKSIAYKLKQPVEKIQIHLIAHHHFSYRIPTTGDPIGLPFHLTVYLDGKDITEQLTMETLFDLLPTRFKRTRGLEGMIMTSASAITVLDAMLNHTEQIVHAPGPNGLPGGYPVKITNTGTQVILPENITLEEAVRINIEGQVLDGVQKIDDEGTVYFTEREMSIVKDIFGYECLRMPINECEYWAKELKSKYDEFVQKINNVQYV